MWLNELFKNETIDFEKRCRRRMAAAACLCLLGIAAAVLGTLIRQERIPVMYLTDNYYDFMSGFCEGTGFGLIAASLITMIKNYRYLSNPELKKKRSIEETDERNRLLGLRAWAYSGYTMFLLLYIGMLLSVFIGVFFLQTLLLVTAVFAVTLLIFRLILSKQM